MEENSSISFWKIAVAVLLAAVLIGTVFLIARQGKSVVNEKLEIISDAIAENQCDGYLIYDNIRVSGNEVKAVINKAADKQDYLCIRVITGMNKANNNLQGTDYNYKGTESENGFKITKISSQEEGATGYTERAVTDENYINPYGTFLCKCKYDANGALVALVFMQTI